MRDVAEVQRKKKGSHTKQRGAVMAEKQSVKRTETMWQTSCEQVGL